MVDETESIDEGYDGPPPRTVFVSDPTVEAERLGEVLRTAGYFVVDVPLATLVPRAAVQRPSVVLLDADSDGAVEAGQRLRALPGDTPLEVIVLGRERAHEEDDFAGAPYFSRPVDVNELLALLERLTGGPPSPLRPPSMPPVLPPVSASILPPSSLSGGILVSALPPPSMRLVETTSSRPPPSRAAASVLPPAPGNGPRSTRSGGFQAPLSAELEALLKEAEERAFSQPALESTPPSPEDEVEAVLPAEILASLDEPISADDEDDGGGEGARSIPPSRLDGGRGARGAPPQSSHPAWASSDSSASSLHETHAGHGGGATTGAGLLGEGRGLTVAGGIDRAEAPAPAAHAAGAAPTAPPLHTASAPPHLTHAPTAPPPAEPRLSRELRSLVAAYGDAEAAAHAAANAAASGARDTADRAAAEAPLVFGPGDPCRVLGRAIAARESGSFTFEAQGIARRVLLQEGDLVTASSSSDDEALVAFLGARGDLPRDTVRRLRGRVPPHGRHGGAALVAHGYLRQDQLWDTLRGHAEWILGRVLLESRGSVHREAEAPGRLRGEPSAFGATPGAAAFVEVVRRVVAPERAVAWLGGDAFRIVDGAAASLLPECGLDAEVLRALAAARGSSLTDVVAEPGGGDLVVAIFGLAQLGVVELVPVVGGRSAPRRDDDGEAQRLEEEAVRERVRARVQLVDEGDYFAVLGLTADATGYEVRRAYLELRKAFEPSRLLTPRLADLHDDVQKVLFVLEEAYEILRDAPRRERYRRAIAAPVTGER